jgi:PadR family transcriptional regulator, regulatory protein AphA
MSRANQTEFAILGLLADEPRSGYDIKKEVEERLAHFWSESYGHIYPMLRRLHERDLVAKDLQRQAGRPDRHVYSLTEDGRRALEDWFTEPPAPGRPRNELLLRIFLGRHGKLAYLLRDVRAFREGAERTLASLKMVSARMASEPAHPDTIYWTLVVDYGIRAFESLAAWSRDGEGALERTARRKSGPDVGAAPMQDAAAPLPADGAADDRPATRAVVRSDAYDWERLRQSLWPSSSDEHAREIRAFFEGVRHDPTEVFLAIDGQGNAIGLAEVSLRSHAEGCHSTPVAYLEALFVEERSRRSGVAAALVAAVEEWGRSMGCEQLASDTEIDNRASAALHRSLGFDEVERIICFRKDL